MRDVRADRHYFDELIESNQQAVIEGRRDAADERLRDEDSALYVDLLQIYRTAAFTLANASYSIGDPSDRTAEYVIEVIRAETLYFRYARLAGQRITMTASPADYVRPLQVLSLAVLLDIDSGVDELIATIGSPGQDSIYDFLTDRDHDASKVGDKVAWLKPYASLLEFVQNPGEPKSMQRFLHYWYNQNRRAIWWGAHLRIKEGDRRYSGYWCFEAAAVTKLLHADDAPYCNNEYYPKDLLT